MVSQETVWWNYGSQQMESAAKDVSLGVPLSTAAKSHGVPRTSLRRYVRGGAEKFHKMGRLPVLTQEEEELLVLWISSIAQAGFTVNREDLLDSVQQLLQDSGRKNDFVNGRPGRSWLECFLKRNSRISTRVAHNLTVTRASVTQQSLQKWFSGVFDYLREKGLDKILHEPNRVFNAEETAFFLNPQGNKVLVLKGAKKINSSEKECITVLITANAGGQLGPPLVVFNYESVPQHLVNSIPPNWGFGKSENGWMTGPLFYEYLSDVFHPWLMERSIPRPVILFVDGHMPHLTLNTSRFCHENGIVLICLLPNATHLIQPMDVAVFPSLKENWKSKVHEWRLENPILKKEDFCPLLKDVLEEKISPTIVQDGFRKCGLMPWDPLAPITTNRKHCPSLPATVRHSDEELKEHFIGSEKVDAFKKKCDVLTTDEVLILPEESISIEEIGDQRMASSRSIMKGEENQSCPVRMNRVTTNSDGQTTVFLEVAANNANKGCDRKTNFQSETEQLEMQSPCKRSMYWPFSNKKMTTEIISSEGKDDSFSPLGSSSDDCTFDLGEEDNDNGFEDIEPTVANVESENQGTSEHELAETVRAYDKMDDGQKVCLKETPITIVNYNAYSDCHERRQTTICGNTGQC